MVEDGGWVGRGLEERREEGFGGGTREKVRNMGWGVWGGGGRCLGEL